MRFRVYFLHLAFIITLAAVVGWRLTVESLPIALGVLAGVAASIPTSFLVAWAAARATLHRRETEASDRSGPTARHHREQPAPRRDPFAGHAPAEPDPQPRVIIIQPSPVAAWPSQSTQSATPLSALPAPRTFTFLPGSDPDTNTALESSDE